MNGTSDTSQAASADSGGFGPQEAAALADQAGKQARRRFEPNPPLLAAIRALVVLAAYTAIWLSVRGQHPYTGPNGWVIAIAYTLVIVIIGASVATTKRATAGVGGQSRRQLRAGVSVLVVAWIAVYVFEGALYHVGVSHAVAYGLYPAAAPLLIIGLVAAAYAAGTQDWLLLGTTLTVAAVAAVAGFAGPAGVWLVMGIGLTVAMAGNAAVTARRQRA